MNKIILKGRLSKDVEVRYSQAAEPVAIANFSVAIDRKIKRDGQPNADFFNCIAFGKTAEFLEKYFIKGQEILIEGSVQNRSWEDSSGVKRYATDIVVESVEFCGSKNDNNKSQPDTPVNMPKKSASEKPHTIAENIDDDDLPF